MNVNPEKSSPLREPSAVYKAGTFMREQGYTLGLDVEANPR